VAGAATAAATSIAAAKTATMITASQVDSTATTIPMSDNIDGHSCNDKTDQ
jgi:hypothetical protein